YTYVNLMANTNPVCSTAEMAMDNIQKAEKNGICDIHQTLAITQNFDGFTIDHLNNLPAFVKAVSDDGKGVTNNDVMAKVMKLSKEKDFWLSATQRI
ncbi:MAG: dihydroorotase, partial [Oscillospiraceae bacterium]